MCVGRSLASLFLRRLAGRGAFILRFSHSMGSAICVTFSTVLQLREWLSGSSDCDRPCDLLSCLLFTAQWLHCSQTLVMQETSSAQDAALTCSLTSLFGGVTCLPIRTHVLGFGLFLPLTDSKIPSLPPGAAGDGLRRVVQCCS